jgi:hypothetical protein
VRTLSARIEAAEAALADGESMRKHQAVKDALGRVYLHFSKERRASHTKAMLVPDGQSLRQVPLRQAPLEDVPATPRLLAQGFGRRRIVGGRQGCGRQEE